jgi:hypothetical protein
MFKILKELQKWTGNNSLLAEFIKGLHPTIAVRRFV